MGPRRVVSCVVIRILAIEVVLAASNICLCSIPLIFTIGWNQTSHSMNSSGDGMISGVGGISLARVIFEIAIVELIADRPGDRII